VEQYHEDGLPQLDGQPVNAVTQLQIMQAAVIVVMLCMLGNLQLSIKISQSISDK
jgi:hypothetical protein